jgi:hypothetical protein
MSIRAAFDSKWQILRIAVVMLSPSQNRRQPSAQKADLNNPYFFSPSPPPATDSGKNYKPIHGPFLNFEILGKGNRKQICAFRCLWPKTRSVTPFSERHGVRQPPFYALPEGVTVAS